MAPSRALGHHLVTSQLELRPVQGGELRGRFLLAPRAFPPAAAAADSPQNPAEAQEVLLKQLGAGVTLSIAGSACATPLIAVEVWTEASPSPGHLVDVRCPVPSSAGPNSVDVFWRGPGDLAVHYPPTETTAAVSLVLAPGAQGNVALTPVHAPPSAGRNSEAPPERTDPSKRLLVVLLGVVLVGAALFVSRALTS